LRRKILIGVAVAVVLGAGGLFFWARSVLTQDTVRSALAAQLSTALGQPVVVGSIGATIFPRVAVNLGEVKIGEPARIHVRTLQVGTDIRALLSRRIEHATVRLDGARIELPLPPFDLTSTDSTEASPEAGSAPVQIVSIDEILLRDITIVSGGRTLGGEVDAELNGDTVTLRRIRLVADDANIEATGRITDLSGPVGELAIKAAMLNLDRLLAFAADFSGGMTPVQQAAKKTDPGAAGASGMQIAIAMEAERATSGGLTLEKLSGRALVTDKGVTIEPIGFGLFGGRYDGTLALTTGRDVPVFRWNAKLSSIDVASATKFAGSPDTMTGRLSGRIDVTGRGADAAAAIRTARGTARVDITDGVVRNLGLVRTVVLATSMRGDAGHASGGSKDEPFSRLGATLAIANGAATTRDLRFESDNLILGAAGTVQLDGSALDLAGQLQLSDQLSQQAGRDLIRYAGEGGRVTLPATITGSAQAPKVRLDTADIAKRAIRNRLGEEAQSAIKKRLGGILR
jgi:uncharacterized protein involved in outer membrane biogenesis